MDRETVIKYMKQAVACDKTPWETCQKYKMCVNCPNHFPIPLVKVVRAALELIEGGQQEADRWIPVTEALPEEDGDYLVTFDRRYAEGYALDDMLLRGVRSLKHIKRRKRNETDRSNR